MSFDLLYLTYDLLLSHLARSIDLILPSWYPVLYPSVEKYNIFVVPHLSLLQLLQALWNLLFDLAYQFALSVFW